MQKRNYFITGWDDDALYHTGTACHGTGESVYIHGYPEACKSGQYTGNEGDSFVYTIGQHQYTRGNTDIYGNSYTHGIEAWIARWNYTPEISWAYSTYNIGNKYKNWRQNWS